MPRSYNQFCPVAKAAEVFCERWTPLIIRELATGASRFSELQRGMPMASPTLLSNRLRQLEMEGIVERYKAESQNRWQYRLSGAGKDFIPIVMALGVWGQRWSRRELAEHEMDLGLLLWALEKGANPASFGERRTVVEFDIVDQPERKRHWWFLNENGHCELCITPPSHDADIYVAATLENLIRVWRGDIALRRALTDEVIEVHGVTSMRRAFVRWLAIASVADVKPASASGLG